MIDLIFLIILCLSPFASALAQTTDRDSFEVGVEAFNAGNCEEALRIMKKYEREQPSAAYVVQACSLMKSSPKKGTGISYDVFLDRLNKGDLKNFENLGMINRFQGEISGLSGSQYINSLLMLAKRNDTSAVFRLGLLYQEGIGLPRNFKTAASYFETAAENGLPEAMNSLGLYYRFGIGVKEDAKKAEEWWRKALLKKNAYALYNLGRMYFENDDFMTAQILADLAVKRINPSKEKKYNMLAQSLLKKARTKTPDFHTEYLRKFRPFWLKDALSPEEAKGLTIVKEMPEPPAKMIAETAFMRFIRKDEFDNRYKTFFPLMPSWVPFDPDSPANPEINGKTPPAPFPQEKETLSALYFRHSDPRYVDLTLNRKESALPVMPGDILTLYVYTPLHETKTTLKGGHMSVDNTDYKIVIRDPAGVVAGYNNFLLTPLSAETARQEAWLSRTFIVRSEGSAVISFIPDPASDKKDVFPYTLRLTSFRGKPPK